MTTSNIQTVLDPTALYFTDNGATFHGECCGSSARYTGRDISGQKVEKVTPEDLAQAKAEGWEIRCEAGRCPHQN